MTEDTAETIDELMGRLQEPGYITNIPRKDLDRHIAYQRKQRALREAGVKTKKPRGEAAPSLSLNDLLSTIPKPKSETNFKRRW